jgi:hypothetical protein
LSSSSTRENAGRTAWREKSYRASSVFLRRRHADDKNLKNERSLAAACASAASTSPGSSLSRQ